MSEVKTINNRIHTIIYYDCTIAYPSIATVTTPALAFIASIGVATLSIHVTRIKVKSTLI